MISHVAFLRAINTGGRRVTNDELASSVEALGFDEVALYQASGNVLLSSDDPSPVIAERLGVGLAAALGYEVPAIVRTAAEVRGVVDADPFPGEVPPSASKPQVIFLATPVTVPSDVERFATREDRLAAVDGEIHWWPRAGVSTSELRVAALERAVGTMTIRTLGSIERIARKLPEEPDL